ncbi:cell surface glycoprotein 1-like [Xiphias gladius]|uniref:cell surface glycoprotein 1-like n=1 Tax=Xiphias gladius TaxID=8245 RepID=UPI001A98B16B|nr:cell surface glycoprotein 1-like [Xiphias gladius]
MGNRFSRRRDITASSGETNAAEQKAAEEPAAPQPAEESGIAPTQEAVETENLDDVVVVGEPETVEPRLPSEECTSECKEVEAPAASAALNDADPEPVAKETPAPVGEPSPPESEPVAEPEPVAEAQLAPEPAPEPVPDPGPTSFPEAGVEALPEPTSELVPAPAEAVEQQTDMLTLDSLSEPSPPSPPLVDLCVPDVTPQPVNTTPSPAPIPDPVDADEPSDIPVTEERQDGAEAARSSTLEPERPEGTSESLEKLMEEEAAENLEQLVSDVNEESISGLLQNLELKGNDLVTDLIPSDVKIPDDTPITDVY